MTCLIGIDLFPCGWVVSGVMEIGRCPKRASLAVKKERNPYKKALTQDIGIPEKAIGLLKQGL